MGTMMIRTLIEHPGGEIVYGLYVAEGKTGKVTRLSGVNMCQRHRKEANERNYSHFIPTDPATGPCEWCLEEEYENNTD